MLLQEEQKGCRKGSRETNDLLYIDRAVIKELKSKNKNLGMAWMDYKKSSKLITWEENIISVQQLPLCLPLFFVFSSETLNSGIKAVLMELFFKMQFVKNVLVYLFSVFTLSVFVNVFTRVLYLKLF